jgi:hypothetical protein
MKEPIDCFFDVALYILLFVFVINLIRGVV